jgi:hypothetical protein
MQPVQVDPAQAGSGLLNMVLAFLAPVNPDENERYDDEILDLNVIGFLVVYVAASWPMAAAYSPFISGRTSIFRTGS